MTGDDKEFDQEPLLAESALRHAFVVGERGALTRVFRHYAPRLAHRLRRGVTVKIDGIPLHVVGVRSEFDIEAIVQETFARAFEPSARTRYDGTRPFLPYLTAIARNLLIDDARRRRRRRTVSVADVEALVSEESHEDVVDPDRSLDEARWRAALTDVVSSLPARERAVYAARFAEGKTLEEAAQLLPFSLSTIRRTEVQIRTLLVDGMAARGFFKQRPD